MPPPALLRWLPAGRSPQSHVWRLGAPSWRGRGQGGFSFPPRGHCVGFLGRGTSRLPPTSKDAFELECCAPSGKGAKRGGLGSLLFFFCTQTQQAVLKQWLFRQRFTLGMIFWGCKTVAFCWVWSKFRLQSTSHRLAMRSCVRTAGSRGWDKFPWLEHCRGAAGIPLEVPARAGIRVAGGAGL